MTRVNPDTNTLLWFLRLTHDPIPPPPPTFEYGIAGDIPLWWKPVPSGTPTP